MVRERGAEEMNEILRSDEAIQRFGKALPLNAQSAGLGSSPRAATVVIDVPLASLRELADSTGRLVLRWQLRVRAPGGSMVVSRDTVRRIALPPPGDEKVEKAALVTLVDEADLPSGRFDLRLVVSDTLGGRGALYHREGVVVLAAGQPGISDVILMPVGSPGVARSIEGETVRLSPTFAPGTTGEMEIGYVLAGLAGQEVRVSLAAWKVGDDSARARIAVTSTERPSADRQFIRRRVGLKELDEGAYDLIVTLTLPDGTTQERRQRILVRE